MVHLFQSQHTFNHPWSVITAGIMRKINVVIANWRKYPNDQANHVLSCDVINRHLDPDTGILTTERLLRCRQAAPPILRTLGIAIPEEAFFKEISTVDPVRQEFRAVSVNMTLTQFLTVKETCTFTPMGDGNTMFHQQCQAMAPSANYLFGGIARYVEEAALRKFGENIDNGRKGLEQVIQGLEGYFESKT